MDKALHHPASFRDPSGFVFKQDGKIYRQVNQCYADHYRLLLSSGLYSRLTGTGKLIVHTELQENLLLSDNWFLTLLPEQIEFISYPYEWCFDQLKDAALLTLDIVREAIAHGMILKDATPFNIQFIGAKPVFIDTLSFERYDSLALWVAYRQFIECFVAPLLLTSYRSPELIRVLQLYPDGIPLSLAAKLLPFRSRFNFNVLLHVFLPLHISSPSGNRSQKEIKFSRQKLINIINSLHTLISRLELKRIKSTWNDYYSNTVSGNDYVDQKKKILEEWLELVHGNTVLDIGSNTGLFARQACAKFVNVVAIDTDPWCINDLYRESKKTGRSKILSLCVDISQPTPAIGWNNKERGSFFTRCKADVVFALALIHHIAISKNIPIPDIAEKLSQLCNFLIIEFVPKNDPKVVLMLQDRKDIFDEYSESLFEDAFSVFFIIERKIKVHPTDRVLYLMKKR
jgi:hypothetical protein